jgi:hypothetical protein
LVLFSLNFYDASILIMVGLVLNIFTINNVIFLTKVPSKSNSRNFSDIVGMSFQPVLISSDM